MSLSMASAPTSNHNIDLEAQRDVLRRLGVGGAGTHETSNLRGQSETKSGSSQGLLVSNNQAVTPDVNREPQSIISHNDEVGQRRSATLITDVNQPKHNGGPGHPSTSTQVGSDEKQFERAREAAIDATPVNGDPPRADGGSDPEPHMIGDFDGSANALWTLYGEEAKSHDEARIQTLKDDMDGVLIFAGLFSAILTAFVIDGKQSLEANSGDQMVYLLQQNVAILAQISQQISSITPQAIPSPSSPPASLPFLDFVPSTSDIVVNAFWFTALILSLSAALLATLVRQWVHNYMHVFQRYSDPLKKARLRQYLYEGSERSHMPAMAEAIPAILHVSLFLFLMGYCQDVLGLQLAIGLSTFIPIVLTCFLYVLVTVAPIIYPQSPCQTSFSGLIWSMRQRFGGRQFKDRDFNGTSKSVNRDMAQGQMQLAMEETEDRKGRDERAVRWLVSNMTEDGEMESFVMAIPGSFNGEWGTEVWKRVSNTTEDRNESLHQNEPSRMPSTLPSSPRRVRNRTANDSDADAAGHVEGEDTVGELSARVKHLLDTCKHHGLFANEELWRRRTRACIETTASLVCCAGAKLGQFGDIIKLLGDISSDQTVRKSSLVGKEQSFVMRWTCLSLIAIRPILDSNRSLQDDAGLASQRLEGRDSTDEEQTRAEKISETLDKASRCLNVLSNALIRGLTLTQEQVRDILREHESRISSLEQIVFDIENGGFPMDDSLISSVQTSIDQTTHGVITRQLPGVKSDLHDSESVDFSQFVGLFRDAPTFLFIFPSRNLKRIRSFAQTLRNILEGQESVDTIKKTIKDLREFRSLSNWSDKPVLRQVWRLQDLSGGGGLGFTVELFFLALKQLLSTSSSKESHSVLYHGTFRAITSDWSKYKDSLGTQRLLLDMVVPHGGIIFGFDYPIYIIDEFLAFLGNIFEGQTGTHIQNVVQQLTGLPTDLPGYALSVKVLKALPS